MEVQHAGNHKIISQQVCMQLWSSKGRLLCFNNRRLKNPMIQKGQDFRTTIKESLRNIPTPQVGHGVEPYKDHEQTPSVEWKKWQFPKEIAQQVGTYCFKRKHKMEKVTDKMSYAKKTCTLLYCLPQALDKFPNYQ